MKSVNESINANIKAEQTQLQKKKKLVSTLLHASFHGLRCASYLRTGDVVTCYYNRR